MANTRTLAQLRTSIQIRGGYENSADITSTVLNDVINEAIAELYDIIVGKWADYYTVLSNNLLPIGDVTGTGDSLAVSSGIVTLTDAGASFRSEMVGQRITLASTSNTINANAYRILTVPSATTLTFAHARAVAETSSFTWSIDGSASFALPSDFYKLRKVEILASNGTDWKRLYPHDLEAAHRLRTPVVDKEYRYRMQAGNLVLAPDPGSTTETVRIYYIPYATRLSADADTFDGINNYEELVIQIALKRCKGDREDLDVSAIEREIERLSMRVKTSSDGRDAEPFYLDPGGPTRDYGDLDEGDFY